MSESILFLLSHPEQYKKFSVQARKRALQFDKKKIIPLYIKLYHETLQQFKSGKKSR
jgi:hypothetical protein